MDAGARYYGRTNTGLRLGPDQILARLVTSFATKDDEIDRFAYLRSLIERPDAVAPATYRACQ